jgi:hypothetical protein
VDALKVSPGQYQGCRRASSSAMVASMTMPTKPHWQHQFLLWLVMAATH